MGIAVAAHAGRIGAPTRQFHILPLLRAMRSCDFNDDRIVAAMQDFRQGNGMDIKQLREESFDEAVLEAISALAPVHGGRPRYALREPASIRSGKPSCKLPGRR